MAHRNLKIRFFFVGEDDSLHRIPVARYERIFNRAQPIRLYAGKSLRFVEAVVQRDDNGNEELVNASFLRHQFDERGLWDTNEKDERMRGAVEAVSAVGKDAYMDELSRIEHIDPYRWKPTADLVERLFAAIRTKNRHS
jgi:hypothetical protein